MNIFSYILYVALIPQCMPYFTPFFESILCVCVCVIASLHGDGHFATMLRSSTKMVFLFSCKYAIWILVRNSCYLKKVPFNFEQNSPTVSLMLILLKTTLFCFIEQFCSILLNCTKIVSSSALFHICCLQRLKTCFEDPNVYIFEKRKIYCTLKYCF